ncbi:phosphoadenosine phosphosulfate reductase domain-containing protein [Oceanibaculum indicum]|uniref:DNA sulfur modification protein DndC n=1 Tax=Oceanibaculum indicum TaxID=526216 RepID=A0A420WGN0_9PROT|nr:phosphoadenosine phosphosulfate reductase family protein [Oceanibaculum indicum]RKQ70137.1 DNA sulfur modification protein DndC [Oceanibaculum indicum]
MSGAVSLFAEPTRMTMQEAIDLTVQSLRAYGEQHQHWGIAYSGGKDSSATLTLVLHLIETGQVPQPESLTVYYADTRQELPPLALAAQAMLSRLTEHSNWVRSAVVTAPLDKRFLVYILGRGVPPPNNNTLRWCTRQIKVDPMTAAIAEHLKGLPGNLLMITGVRQGESAVRDRRIEMSCGKDGAECGQGWYQQVLPESPGIRGRIATLAPLLHWRVCHVWDWLRFHAPAGEYGGWPTALVADAYGGEEAEEINARTGCTGCPLASRDTALDNILRRPEWTYLAPLKGLKPLYQELRLPQNRLKKTGLDGDGNIARGKNKQRMGPLTFEARLMALDRVLAIQAEINKAAKTLGRPEVDLVSAEEEARIRDLITLGTWPNGWEGDEPRADKLMDHILPDGTVMPNLLAEMDIQDA